MLKERYDKLKEVADLHKYKDKNQLEVLLILYLIIFGKIKENNFDFNEILNQ